MVHTAKIIIPVAANRGLILCSRRVGNLKLNKTDEQIITALKASKELTLAEICEKTGLTGKKVFRSLRKLFEAEMIESKARKYRLLTDKPPAKGKAEEQGTEEEE